MKYVVPLFAVLLLGADCGDEPAPTTRIDIHAVQSIKDWKAAGLPWHQRCSPYLVYLHPVPQDDLNYYCGVSERLWACLDGFDIYIAEEIMDTVRTDYVVEHELRHLWSGCEFGTVDGAHADDRIWFPYRGVNIRY
jgi:hypothetical protein